MSSGKQGTKLPSKTDNRFWLKDCMDNICLREDFLQRKGKDSEKEKCSEIKRIGPVVYVFIFLLLQVYSSLACTGK